MTPDGKAGSLAIAPAAQGAKPQGAGSLWCGSYQPQPPPQPPAATAAMPPNPMGDQALTQHRPRSGSLDLSGNPNMRARKAEAPAAASDDGDGA